MDITLENIGKGALVEMFEKALREVALNTTDPNTDATTKRELTIKLTFAPDKHDRAKMKMTTDVKTKLGQPRPLESVVMFGHDPDTGEVAAVEYAPVQPSLFDNPVTQTVASGVTTTPSVAPELRVVNSYK